jgi:hypothetical protein
MRLSSCVVAAALLAACGEPAPPSPVAAFPADYAASYQELRSCRKSADHELSFVRVLADESALGPYRDRASPFPDGAIVLKEQYDPGDATCSGTIAQWTVMRKNASATERLTWDWQRVAADRSVVEADTASCYGCHASCTGAEQAGYDFTCADP